ncbi:translational activator of GCN4 [Vanrija albida]|uniref:Translational activator of GCN4 n=1 Tax=Vanrija albida TaxID=181172 RepID=A0ABR3PSS5_9TREE
MSTKAKVGSWLGKGSAEAKGDANDSDSEASDITAPSEAGDAAPPARQADDDDEDDDDDDGAITPADAEAARELNIDWEVVLPKVRPALLDKSRKRREDFVARFLYVSDESPAPAQIPGLLKELLSSLTASGDLQAVELNASVLMALVARDESQQAALKLGDKLVKWAVAEVEKAAAPKSTTALSLVPQLTLVLSLLSTLHKSRGDKFASSAQFNDLILALATVTDTTEARSAPTKKHRMDRIRHKVNVRIWRVLRQLYDAFPQIITLLVTKNPTPVRSAVLLGHVVGVALRIKPAKSKPDGKSVIEANKEAIITYYSTTILSAKTALPPHVPSALHEFLGNFVGEDVLVGKLLPTAEKMLLRSAEIALPITADLLDSANVDISATVPGKLSGAIVSASKSSNADTRAKSVHLLKAVARHTSNPESLSKLTTELLALPKTGKSASAEQRVALYTMVTAIPVGAASAVVVDTLPPLIGKEANEAALTALAVALGTHLPEPLTSGNAVAAASATAIAKELASTKLSARRAVSSAVGTAAWSVYTKQGQFSPEGEKVLGSLVAPLEANLKTASANLPSNAAGFLEGFVAIALALGPFKSLSSTSKLASSPLIKGLLTVAPKPSFVLNDKVYTKLSTHDDEIWLLRSLRALISTNDKIEADVRVALGLGLIHLAFDSKHSDVRRETYTSVAELSAVQPKLIAQIIREALAAWLKIQDERRAAARAKRAVGEDEEFIKPHSREIGRLLTASISRSTTADKVALEEIAADLVVIAHHPEIGEDSQVSWISLVQTLNLDPLEVVSMQRQHILDLLWDAASAPPKDSRFAEAAYRAIATLSFIDPEEFVRDVLTQLKADLDPAALDFIGIEERGIWQTPADQIFVDVLSPKKDVAENKNRKNYADEKWEQEVREQLAKKKTTTIGANLSKQDRAAVNAQLAKEAGIRQQISSLQARLFRGLELVAALAESQITAVENQLGTLAHLLISSVFGPAAFLVNSRAFDVFIKLSTLASDRLGDYRRMIAAAILRSYDAPFVPEDYLNESVNDLTTRILHQVNFVAAQSPLDSTTFTLVSMLLSRIVKEGGVGTESPQSDEAQEQLTLVVSIIASTAGEFQNEAYPRLQTIRDLIHIIGNHSKLAKDASAALVDVGDAIRDVATEQEIKEMIAGTLSAESNVRNSVLQALQPVDLTELNYSEELFIASHDADEQNAELADHLWEDNGLDVPETYLDSLIRYLAHSSAAVRVGASAALADAAQQFPVQVQPTVKGLEDLYVEKAKLLQPEFDRFGMIIPETLDRPDPWESRVAIASTFEKLVPLIPESDVVAILDFLIKKEALGDRHEEVRRNMLNAAVALVETHGGQDVSGLMAMFEGHLGQKSTSQTSDYIKEALVILFGRLAGHLDASDERIPKVVDRLVEALNTPSELVQSAVAECLPALVVGMSDEVEYLVDRLFSTLTTGKTYAARRGAAYGLAGVVKGRGLQSLKEYEVLDKLTEAAEDKGSFEGREGALLAFETLSATLGKVFEPYIVQIIPLMLTLFGDTNTYVREAAGYAAKVIMSNISGHCVKLILPTLLSGLDEKQWRTKKGSIELLGSMAYCAPRQLSLSLPTIIPHLTGVINDSHAQVKSAANASLKRFGEVLNNPEIKGMQSTLMKALADPTAKTNTALSALLKTTFHHYLDAPSLALVMPIIDRGLRNRSSETKRKSVQIIGNMAALTESRDLVPYLTELMPLIHDVLVDPVPEARATAAKSLGTLVERLGEKNFPELVDQLLQTLRSDTSGVDRQGAAQGLSEVLSGLGMDRLEGLLPDIINSTSSPRPYVREGFISLLIYLPATFGNRFSPHLARIIPPILKGLADDSEYVRDASMRAGKMIIANYSSKAIDLLLPELEKGMLDSSWRIRQSSISLTGELLYRVTGISGKVELEEDETARGADQTRKALLEALGADRRDRVLATLYIVRQDTVSTVRQSSIHIWKALVQNTPRTTREILPVLMQLLIQLLGSTSVDQQETASRTIGELCRKNGERIVAELMPVLKTAISSNDPRTKEGACLAFADVMDAASRDAIESHEDVIISSIRGALVDPSPRVRAAAARTFDTMQQQMGAKAIDQTIPTLLEAMRNPGESSETALQALKEVMNVRANSVFPVLLPTLTAQPISAFNARAIGALVRVAGSALNRRIDTLLTSLVKSLEADPEEEAREALLEAIESLVASVEDSDGVHLLEMLLIGWAKDVNPVRRATACNIFGTMCQVTEADTEDYRVDWVRILISLFDDPVEEVVTAAWEALEHFVKTIDKDELQSLVVPLRRAIEATGAPGRTVPGFSRTKGAQSVVPILLAGILSGTQEQREQAAYGIGDLVQRTSEAAIKPYIIQLTGPLIRVISGQSIAPQIKGAILQTLTVLLEQVPLLVRPFHPQLTRTFVKSASDPAALSVRNRAAAGLGELMKHQPRVDPLITELIGGVASADKEVAPSVVAALAAVCNSAGKNIGPAAKTSIIELVEDAFMLGAGDSYNNAIASVLSGLAKFDVEAIRPVVDTYLAAPTPPAPLVSTCIASLIENAPDAFYELDVVEDIVRKVQASVSSDIGVIARPAREARDLMRTTGQYEKDTKVQAVLR